MKRLFIVVLAIAVAESAFSQEFDKKNLLYRVIPNENNAVELLGFEKKPKEELIIPEEVSYKGTKYIVKVIGANAFKDCDLLQKVIGLTIQEVKDDAFNGCKTLSNVSFTNQMKTIGKRAFNGCTSLQEIVLGDNVQSIEDAAFDGCSNLKQIQFSNSLKSLGTGIINNTGIQSIILPASLITIGHDAFANCKSLSTVTISDGIKEIEKNAFADCENLESVAFGNGLKSIGNGAFARTSIANLQFPNSLTTIEPRAFEGCKNLQAISLGDDIETIQSKAFLGCSQLTVDFSDLPCDIAQDAFEGCKNAIIGDYSLKGLSRTLKELEMSYEDTSGFYDGLSRIKKGNKYGFINKKGRIVIPIKYEECGFYTKKGFVDVKYGDKRGYVNQNGKEIVLSGDNGHVIQHESGIVELANKGTASLYDKDGCLIASYDYIDHFLNGLALVMRNKKYGWIDETGKLIIPCIYERTSGFCEGLAWVWDGTKGYYIDKTGKKVISSDYIIGEVFHEGVVLVGNSTNGYTMKFGYMDKLGKVITEIKYDKACDFKDGIGCFQIGDKCGGVDKNGTLLFQLTAESINQFHEGLALVKKDGKYGYVDRTGKMIVPFIYDYAYDFKDGNGVAHVSQKGTGSFYINKKGTKVAEQVDSHDGFSFAWGNDNKFGLLNKDGEIVAPFIYDRSSGNLSLSNSFIKVYKGYKEGCLDFTGKEILPCKYEYVIDLFEGMILAKENEKISLFDKTGKTNAPFIYDGWSGENGLASRFKDGISPVKKNDMYGLIDINGNEIAPCIYANSPEFHEGLAWVAKNVENGWKGGYIDRTGKEIIPCIYDETMNFHEGLAGVSKKGKWGYIDKTGKEIIPCIYDETRYFQEGLAWVVKNGKLGMIDKTGKSTFDYQ